MMKNIFGLTFLRLLLSCLLVGSASAEEILLHEEPIEPYNVSMRFKVNPERNLAGVNIGVDRSGFSQIRSYPTEILKTPKGLIYDPATKEVRFGDAVCAKVTHRSFLQTRWHTVDQTGTCKLVKKTRKVIVDNGVDEPHHYTVTQVILDNG